MKVAELFEDDDSFVLDRIRYLLDSGKTVYLNAHAKTTQAGPVHRLVSIRRRYDGKIKEVKHDYLIYDHDRARDPSRHVYSNSSFIFEKPIDEHYTIRKNPDDSFELVDVEHVTESTEESIPFVWQMAHKLKHQGKRVSVNARIAVRPGLDDDSGLADKWLNGEIMFIDVKNKLVDIYADRRSHFILMLDAHDEELIIKKDNIGDYYWVENHEDS